MIRTNLLIVLTFLYIHTYSQNQLVIPDTLSGSVLNLTLQNGNVNFFPGQATNTMGVNGNILGPTLILNKHQQVTINVNNQLGEPTTIHWHGLHVSPENDGGPHIIIQPGSTWSPSFEVLDWASTHWYHPHLHHHTNEHVLKGIAGFIISRDSNESSLNLPRTYGVDDFPLVVQTKAFNANNQIEIHSALDTALMVNATLKPYLDLPAQVVRLRLLNGSSERYYNFGFSGNRSFQVIASDAGLLTSPVQMTRLLMAPGERTEILVDLNGLTGQTLYLMNYGAEIPNGIYGASQPGMGQGQSIPNYNQNPLNGSNFNILQINVVPQTTNPITSIPSQLSTHNPWAESLASRTRTFTFNTVNQGPTAINGPFRINGALFDMAVINFNVEFEDVEIWQITNQTPIGHPFHLHGFPFYVLSINGQMPPAHLRGRKDVIHVPAGQGVVRFITKFENFYHDSLPYMYHCHMLTHEDDGMMGQFLVKRACELTFTNQVTDFVGFVGGQAQFTAFTNDSTTIYQWQTNLGFGFQNLSDAGQYSGVNTSTITVSNLGISNNNQQFRCVINNDQCSDTSNVAKIEIDGDVSASSIYVDSDIRIFPNPNANNRLFIQGLNPTNVYTAKIFDLQGRLVISKTITNNSLKLDGLSPSIYIMEVSNMRQKQSFKLVIE